MGKGSWWATDRDGGKEKVGQGSWLGTEGGTREWLGYRRWDKVVGGVQKVGQGSGWGTEGGTM